MKKLCQTFMITLWIAKQLEKHMLQIWNIHSLFQWQLTQLTYCQSSKCSPYSLTLSINCAINYSPFKAVPNVQQDQQQLQSQQDLDRADIWSEKEMCSSKMKPRFIVAKAEWAVSSMVCNIRPLFQIRIFGYFSRQIRISGFYPDFLVQIRILAYRPLYTV